MTKTTITATTLAALLCAAFDLSAQSFRWPEAPENLRALPPSVKGAELGALMRGFATALDVRCPYCHSGRDGEEPDPMELTSFDFASDENPMKEKARAMIRMVRSINGDHLERLGASVTVTCVTCHRGQRQPRMLQDVLAEVIEESGAEAAVRRYGELREAHYGGFSYNFEPGVLGNLGERLLGEGRTDDAVRILELEVETNPEFAYGRYLMATAYDEKGETSKAVEQMERAVALASPEQGRSFFERALQGLKEKN